MVVSKEEGVIVVIVLRAVTYIYLTQETDFLLSSFLTSNTATRSIVKYPLLVPLDLFFILDNFALPNFNSENRLEGGGRGSNRRKVLSFGDG